MLWLYLSYSTPQTNHASPNNPAVAQTFHPDPVLTAAALEKLGDWQCVIRCLVALRASAPLEMHLEKLRFKSLSSSACRSCM